MKSTRISIFSFGLYMICEGLILLIIPGLFLSFLNFNVTDTSWVRLLGIALLVLGYYYLQAAKANLKVFFLWTVQMRTVQFFLVTVLFMLRIVHPLLLLFSFVEALFGVWTYVTLRKERS